MPYFSLIEKPPVPSSEEMDDDSDSYPDLETCPKQPAQAPATLAQDWGQDAFRAQPTPPAPSPVLNPPDWQELLFGGQEKKCDPITKKFRPTYFEDCKLAEDTALNHIAKFDMPVFNCLRDVNHHQVTRALKLLRKGEFGKKKLTGLEEVLAYILMMDFVSCCCQEGNLFSLYEKCKDGRKRYHIDSIDTDLGSAIEYLEGCTLKQIQSADRLVKASVHRIPSSLYICTYCTKNSFKRKLFNMEKEEKNLKENPIYHFNDDLCSPSKKKFKPSSSTVTATTKSWKKRPIQGQNTTLLQFYPRKEKTVGFITKPQLEVISTPSKCEEGEELPVSPNVSNVSLNTSTPKSPRSSYFLKELFMPDEDECPRSKHPSQVSRQLLTSKENVSPKKRTDFLSSPLSDQRVLQMKPDMKPISGFVDISTLPQSNGYASDDSLPDIPIDLKSYVSKKKHVTPKKSSPIKAPKMPVPCSPCSSGLKTSTSTVHTEIIGRSPQKASSPLKSPYKNKFTMWKSSKMKVKSPVRSTAVAVMRSPFPASKEQNDNGLSKSSKLQHLSKPNGVPRIYWFQFRNCLCGKCKHGEILAVRLVLPVKFNTEEAENEVKSMVRNSKRVKCRCGNCVPELLNEENYYDF